MSSYFKNPNPTPGLGTSFSDVEIHLPTPVCHILLTARIAGGHLYFHSMPLSKIAVAGVIPVTGREAWISLTEFVSIRFEKRTDSFFLTGDGAPPDFMLLCTDEVEDMQVESSPVVSPLPVTFTTPVDENLKQQAGVNLSAPIADAPTGAETAPVVRTIGRKRTTIETTTPLGIGGVFTGQWHDSESDGTIFLCVSSFANQAGSFQIQESDDNTNANFTRVIEQPSQAANTLARATVRITARYYRIVFTNGAAAQASFELTTCAMSEWAMAAASQNGESSGTSPFNIPVVSIFAPGGIPISNIGGDVQCTAIEHQTKYDGLTSASSSIFPLGATIFMWGGAFSGTADATRSGIILARTPTVFKTIQATAAGNTAIWTPGAGNKFRLLRVILKLTSNATLAAPGILTITLNDGAGATPIAIDFYISNVVAPVFQTHDPIVFDLGTFGILSAAANNVLNVNLSAALVTGNARVVVCGVEE